MGFTITINENVTRPEITIEDNGDTIVLQPTITSSVVGAVTSVNGETGAVVIDTYDDWRLLLNGGTIGLIQSTDALNFVAGNDIEITPSLIDDNVALTFDFNGNIPTWTVVSSSITAANDQKYSNLANATYTDPTPVEGKGYIVKVVNGTATVGGTAYTEGSIITRTYHSGSWRNKEYVDLSKIPSSGSGDVVGPASSTDNAIARFDSTTGKLLQNSNVTIDDNGNITSTGKFDLDFGSSVFIGKRAGQNDDGSTNFNLAIGNGAGESITSGYQNVLFGANAGRLLTTSFLNVAIGTNALAQGTTGIDGNFSLGAASLRWLTNGSNNVAIGNNAGRNITGGSNMSSSDDSIFIGVNSKANGNSQTNQIVIGRNAEGNGSNTVTIGNSSITDNHFNGNVHADQYRLSALNTAPSSATDTGTTGEIRVTSTHIYVCTATNTWVRAALSTW